MKPGTFLKMETWILVIGVVIAIWGSIIMHVNKLPWSYAQYIIAIPEIFVVIAMWLVMMWYLVTTKEPSDNLPVKQP